MVVPQHFFDTINVVRLYYFCFYFQVFPWQSIKDKVLSKIVKKLYIAISYNLYISLIFYVEPFHISL